jgi:hypothetical protein
METQAAKPSGEELDFVNLVLLLGGTASLDLGIRSEQGRQKAKDLPRARSILSMLSALKAKTEGRLNPQEAKVLESVLSDLQAKYVEAAGLKPSNPAMASWAAQQYAKNKR